MNTNDGGPASPRLASVDTKSGTLPDGDVVIPEQSGMSLRDYFAAHALSGYLAAHAGEGIPMPGREKAAVACYQYADAMIAARNQMPVAPEAAPTAS